MRGWTLSSFYLIFLLSFIIGYLDGSHEVQKKNPPAVVVGTVYCDTCFQNGFSKSSHFLSGASVAVECKDGTAKPSFRQEVKTDEHGEFKVHLPFSVSKHVKKIKRCSVKLINSREPYCAVASTATSSSLHLKERKQGIHIFSAGVFTFKPLKQPNLCNQKPSLENSEELNSQKTSSDHPFNDRSIFPPPVQDPTSPDPPLLPLPPRLPPLPELPTLPPLPGLPNLPPMPGKISEKKTEEVSSVNKLSDQKASRPEFSFPTASLPPNPSLPTPIFPPNPLQPPSVFPPNPFQPSPLLPPNPLQPPPLLPPIPLIPPLSPLIPFPPVPGLNPPRSPLIPLPPVPGLNPPPSPLIPLPPVPGLNPPPSFPFPLPPFPPRIPGIPPASATPKKPSP